MEVEVVVGTNKRVDDRREGEEVEEWKKGDGVALRLVALLKWSHGGVSTLGYRAANYRTLGCVHVDLTERRARGDFCSFTA